MVIVSGPITVHHVVANRDRSTHGHHGEKQRMIRIRLTDVQSVVSWPYVREHTDLSLSVRSLGFSCVG